MSFRARIALSSAVAVALAVVVASILVFFVVRTQLRKAVDSALQQRADQISQLPALQLSKTGGIVILPHDAEGFGGPGATDQAVQVVRTNGKTFRTAYPNVALPVTDNTLGVARGDRDTDRKSVV